MCLKRSKLIIKGGYGTVWSARLDDHDCAVKTFSVNERSSWDNEKKIYGEAGNIFSIEQHFLPYFKTKNSLISVVSDLLLLFVSRNNETISS